MAMKILIAIDDSKHAEKAIKYVADNIRLDSEITLFSVLEDAASACELDAPSLTPIFIESRAAFCSIEDAKKRRVQEFASRAKASLIDAGFGAGAVHIHIRKRRSGVASDILKEMKDGAYKTVIIGRRGKKGLKDFFMGSVSQKVVALAQKVAVVVVD